MIKDLSECKRLRTVDLSNSSLIEIDVFDEMPPMDAVSIDTELLLKFSCQDTTMFIGGECGLSVCPYSYHHTYSQLSRITDGTLHHMILR